MDDRFPQARPAAAILATSASDSESSTVPQRPGSTVLAKRWGGGGVGVDTEGRTFDLASSFTLA